MENIWVGLRKEYCMTIMATDRITIDGSLKGLKETPPEKKFHELSPVRPYFSTMWSLTRLNDFLMNGTDKQLVGEKCYF